MLIASIDASVYPDYYQFSMKAALAEWASGHISGVGDPRWSDPRWIAMLKRIGVKQP